jgi:putative ATP-dependent endonuclease of the OLD family
MWTMNQNIRTVVALSNGSSIFTQFPHFEGEFLGEELKGGKVDRVLEVLADTATTDYQMVFEAYKKALNKDLTVFTTDVAAFEAKRDAYVTKNSLLNDPFWF